MAKTTLRDFYRDVTTGRFVTKRAHERRPTMTEHERRPIPSPKPEHRSRPGKGK